MVQVRGHAVEVLQRTEDEELLCYLLQLVQALRYEATTHSRLSAFLISRATTNNVMATFLHWYHHNTSLAEPEGKGSTCCQVTALFLFQNQACNRNV